MNRAEFLKMAREMLDEMEADHQAHTGVSDTQQYPFSGWVMEFMALYENTRA